MENILIYTNIISLLLCCVFGYYSVKFGLLILRVQDAIEDSLDELDDSFKELSGILKKPIFFDSVEVRQCISEISRVRNNVIKIADRLTSLNSSDKLTEQEQNGEEVEREKISQENIVVR